MSEQEVRDWIRWQRKEYFYRDTPGNPQHPSKIVVSQEFYDRLLLYVGEQNELLKEPLMFRGIPIIPEAS